MRTIRALPIVVVAFAAITVACTAAVPRPVPPIKVAPVAASYAYGNIVIGTVNFTAPMSYFATVETSLPPTKYGVRFSHSLWIYGTDDSRAANIKPGTVLALNCGSKPYSIEPYGDPRYVCLWGAVWTPFFPVGGK